MWYNNHTQLSETAHDVRPSRAASNHQQKRLSVMADTHFTTIESTEEWRDIPCYEGVYQVSSYGRVISLPRPRFIHSRKEALIRKTFKTGKGKYLAVDLSRENQSHRFYIHELVALVFIGDRPNGYEVNHIDLDKYNNHANNLEYLTHEQNVKHTVAHGKHAHHESSGHAILTSAQVEYIRAHYKFRHPEFSAKAMSIKFGVSDTTIRDAIFSRTWKDDTLPMFAETEAVTS